MQTRLFGIRHHGPGSARSLLRELEKLNPDVILVEGPPDAEEILPMVTHADLRPPVALLLYVPDEPKRSAFYPFAHFSPEWQALKYGVERGIPVRFMDLPQCYQLAWDEGRSEKSEESLRSEEDGEDSEDEDAAPPTRRDPLEWAAEAAGFTDSERFWEHMVELRSDHGGEDGGGIFAAIQELMTAMRKEIPPSERFSSELEENREMQREAWMRQTIRSAQKEGFERIAVVCGAWHVPALAELGPAKRDVDLLKGMAKVKVAATWAPWTYDRLAMYSGYGAGIESPGYYELLWDYPESVAAHWIGSCARLMREEDLDASPASLIETVRLAETLASMRGMSLPGLTELTDAIRAVLCFGNETHLALIARKLVIGEVMGRVPDDAPMPPLQRDLQQEAKRLRLAQEAMERSLDLDLRKPNDLDRSRLLHRLALMGIDWGHRDEYSTAKTSTFHERWKLQWRPELVVNVIEACMWGSTVLGAATARAIELTDAAKELPALTALVERTLLADLPGAINLMMARLESLAGVTSDVAHLMRALPPLASIVRYGNVRGTNTTVVEHVVDGLVARICVGLPAACSALNDIAAAEMFRSLQSVNEAIHLLRREVHVEMWKDTLEHLARQTGVNGLVAGRCCRLLLDQQVWSSEDAGKRLGYALSRAASPLDAAAWVEGFLKGSGLMLLHSDALWQIIDAWVSGLDADSFTLLLPMVRRTFSTFPSGERRQMGERAKQAGGSGRSRVVETDVDASRASLVLPTLAMLLGVSPAAAGSGV